MVPPTMGAALLAGPFDLSSSYATPVLFSKQFWPGIRDGTVTMTFRRWKRTQVVAGHRYRTAAGILEVEQVDVVDASAIRDDEARRAGFSSAAALVSQLRGEPDQPVYRVRFHLVDEPDPRAELAHDDALSADDVTALQRRLDRLDHAAKEGAWTRATLDVIEQHPARRAGDLATMLGRERLPFKADVRKLKNLGLTISLDVGYRLSPRGRAFLEHARRR
jgi:hypothetical protein